MDATQVRDAVRAAVQEARALAAIATENFLTEHGDRDACGFAWVNVYVKGSTRMGKALIAEGFSKAYEGGLQWWNPSGSPTQCITAKEKGAEIAAMVLRQRLGVECYAGSRMD